MYASMIKSFFITTYFFANIIVDIGFKIFRYCFIIDGFYFLDVLNMLFIRAKCLFF